MRDEHVLLGLFGICGGIMIFPDFILYKYMFKMIIKIAHTLKANSLLVES